MMNDLPDDLQRMIWVHLYNSVVEQLNKRYTKILVVLTQFEAMGGTTCDIQGEHRRLLYSDRYYKTWVNDVGSWCC